MVKGKLQIACNERQAFLLVSISKNIGKKLASALNGFRYFAMKDFMAYVKQAEIIEAFKSTSKYLDALKAWSVVVNCS